MKINFLKLVVFVILTFITTITHALDYLVHTQDDVKEIYHEFNSIEEHTKDIFKSLKSNESVIENKLSKLDTSFECDIAPLFSSEKESWPFETFVINGLFPVVVNYQNNHPQAVFIRKGKTSIDELYNCIKNDKIITKTNNTYTLKYPIVIGSNAALILHGVELTLYSGSGAAIINKGAISIVNSKIQGTETNSITDFRGFLTTWAGGAFYAKDSKFIQLGFDGHLTGGISFARSKHQNSRTKPSTVYINKVSFENCHQALWGDDTNFYMNESTIKSSYKESLSLKNSRLYLSGSSIYETINGDGIKLSDYLDGFIFNNNVSFNKENGIKADDITGRLFILENELTENKTNGMSVKSQDADLHQANIIIRKNTLRNNNYSGLLLNEVTSILIELNTFAENKSFGISGLGFKNDKSYIILLNNSFYFNQSSQIHYENIASLLIGPNSFQARAIDQKILSGDLKNIQSDVLPVIISSKGFIEF